MFHKAMTATIAMLLLSATAGCYQNQQVKTADEIAAEQQAAKEAATAQVAQQNRDRYARATQAAQKLTTQVAQQDWEAAKDGCNMVQEQVESILADAKVPMEVKTQVAAVIPYINQARVAISDERARTGQAGTAKAKSVVDQLNRAFARTSQTLVAMGWLPGQGGGAGTGTTPDQTVPVDQEHDGQ